MHHEGAFVDVFFFFFESGHNYSSVMKSCSLKKLGTCFVCFARVVFMSSMLVMLICLLDVDFWFELDGYIVRVLNVVWFSVLCDVAPSIQRYIYVGLGS